MKFGVWFDFRNPPAWRRPYAELYAETLDQIAWAESAGFESVLLSEHHVTDDGYLPSLFPALAAIAVRTSTIRIGTAVLLAPFHHPVRVAEDAAFVDQVSGGRLELGLGLAYRDAEFAALGVARAERASRTEELIEIVRHAWSGEPFSHAGRHWQLEDVVVTPTPAQPGGPPLWLGGTSVAAARRAGRLGCHWVPDATMPVERYAVYRSALEAAGHDPAAFRTATNPTILVSDDPERAWEEAKEHFLYQYNQYRSWQGGEVVASADELPRHAYVVGAPDEVAATVADIVERHRPDRLFFWARPPGLSLEASNRSLQLFAEQVMPRFANPGPADGPPAPKAAVTRPS